MRGLFHQCHARHVLFSLILLGAIYALLLAAYFFLLFHKLNRAADEFEKPLAGSPS